MSGDDAAGRPRLAIGLLAAWALIQTPRIPGWLIAADASAGRAGEAWLFVGIIDAVIGISAPVIAWLLWRKRGTWVWTASLAWFTVSLYGHTIAAASALATPVPAALLGGSRPIVMASLAATALADLAAITAMLRPHLSTYYAGRPGRSGSPTTNRPVPRWVRVGITATAVWALLQISRFIAVAVIGDALAPGGPKAWLGPGIGDIIVAVPSALIAYTLWRRKAPWVWTATVVYLIISIVDHLSTIVAATGTGAIPATFAAAGSTAWAAPALQGAVDMVALTFLMLPAVRTHYLHLAARPPETTARSPQTSTA